MKVLVAHNAYQQRGGEDMVVEAEVALLRAAGHEVELLLRHNDELATLPHWRAAAGTLWSWRTRRDARAALRAFRPEVVHVHNTFPLLSPSLYGACAEAGVPVVQTLHNFRLACPQAMFLREGRVCEDCLGRAPLPALRHACYRGSRAQTAAVVGMLLLHRALGTWQHGVDRYIALNDFCRDRFIAAGLPGERIAVKPNFVAAPAPGDAPRRGFLFVGRLAPEKGLDVLAQAWSACELAGPLRVAGDGPLAPLLQGLPRCAALGSLALPQVQAQMARASALVLPSVCLESFPRTLVEAFGAGLPVIASRLGALPGLVEEGRTGLLFTPGDAADLARCLAWAEANPVAMAHMGRAAREVYEARYTPERNLRQLLDIYAAARAGGPALRDAAAASPAAR